MQPVNAVDAVLLVLLVLAAFRGFRQGALSQIAAFGGAALGLVVGAVAAPVIVGRIVGEPGPRLSLLTLVTLLVIVGIGQAIGVTLGMRLRLMAHRAGVAPVDRAGGIVVGSIGLVVTVWLLASILAQGPWPQFARQVRRSTIVAVIDSVMPAPPDVFGRVGAYLDQQGFPTVFNNLGGTIAPPVDPPPDRDVAAAQRAGARSVVQVLASGCGGVSSGSGFVTRAGYVVTNAHVVAGSEQITVRDRAGEREATPILVDTDIDLAVLRVPDVDAPPIDFTDEPAQRRTTGATLGFPGGQRQLVVKPAAVRGRGEAVGRDIYGRGVVTRNVLTLSSDVQRGDSGGPFVTSDGEVGGVVFAAAASEPGTGYALTAESVAGDVREAIRADERVPTGACRF
jgi:S1-C subfamily serine protease